MNQILFEQKEETNFYEKPVVKTKVKFFKVIFLLSVLLTSATLLYYFYYLYSINQKEQLSNKLKDNFNLASLYTGIDTTYPTKKLTLNDYISEDSNFSVIGLIEIPKININYPILSYINEDLLKIAPCRFFGPIPN